MKAIQIASPGNLCVADIPQSELHAGEVLVKIGYVGFCGSDLNTFLGRNPMVKLPVIPGHEIGATIEQVGADVPADFRAVINHLQLGACPTDELISAVVSVEEASEAMQQWAADPAKVFRILVKF